MLSKIKTCGLFGIDGYIVQVETDISNGLPSFDIVGLADVAVKESKDRVRPAIKNSSLEFPIKKITINLAPADIRKEGSSFDLPIAIGVLVASGQISDSKVNDYIFIGELSLDGEIKPIKGVLPIALAAKKEGFSNLILPYENRNEAAVVEDINILPARNISQVLKHLNSEDNITPYKIDINKIFNDSITYNVDYSDVKGQENVKRALEIAASGGHNCIMIGSPGCGKTMIAKRLPTILPKLSLEEALEVTKIHSIAGLLDINKSLVSSRPFRSPHHSISDVSLIGGGRIPKPGDISLSHHGVLFLDEVAEFSRDTLEVLRQPLEEGSVTISRLNASITYPSQTTFICASNPCKCGNYFEPHKECNCTPNQVRQYLGKISGPLLDRIDIHIEVYSSKYKQLICEKKEESSDNIRKRVNACRQIQLERYKGTPIFSNSQLTPPLIKKFCKLDAEGNDILKIAFEKIGLSARSYTRILKVARTIADMENYTDIKKEHISEAIMLRSLDREGRIKS